MKEFEEKRSEVVTDLRDFDRRVPAILGPTIAEH